MAKYVVNGTATVSVFKVVEADSEDEAREKAETLVMLSLCWQCIYAGENSADTWQIDRIDGETKITGVKADS